MKGKIDPELLVSQEQAKRALADYQNLLRRQQQERIVLVKMATRDLVEEILEPLDHLSLAAEKINDPGLNLVVSQLWQKLKNQGLEEIDPVGQNFDENLMEAISRTENEGLRTEKKVTQVVSKGYKLNGEIIRHAKVII